MHKDIGRGVQEGHPFPTSRAEFPRLEPEGDRETSLRKSSAWAAGCSQPGLTWAAERPGGSEAAEAAYRSGGHHHELKRTKVESIQVEAAGGGFVSLSLAPAGRPTKCLTKTPTPNCPRLLAVPFASS